MATTLRFRRGNTTTSNATTGQLGELFIDTDKKTIVVHDGTTAGGSPLVTETGTQTISNKTVGSDLLPSADSAYDLGSPSAKWKSLYLSGNTLFLGDASISASGSSVVLPAGSTIGETGGSLLDSDKTNALITAAINNLVDAAPAALDTLNEIAAAIGDDANFVNTILPLSGGTMTGDINLGANDITNGGTITATAFVGDGSQLTGVASPLSAVPEDILPVFTEVYDIGSSSKRWYDVFISNSLDINGASLTGDSSGIVTPSILVDELLISDNLITPTNASTRQYLGDKGVVVINGNLDVDGDWLQVPRYAGTNDVAGTITADVTGVAGVIRFNESAGTFEGHDGTAWGSLGGISADENGNATIDANLIVTGDVISLSDQNLKENIEGVNNALDIVQSINGVYYNLKEDPENRRVGVIAQNVEEVLPEVVYTSNGNKSVAYGNIVGVLIEAIKELKAEIEELKNGV